MAGVCELEVVALLPLLEGGCEITRAAKGQGCYLEGNAGCMSLHFDKSRRIPWAAGDRVTSEAIVLVRRYESTGPAEAK